MTEADDGIYDSALKFKPTKTQTIITDQSSSSMVFLVEKVVGSRRVGPSDNF